MAVNARGDQPAACGTELRVHVSGGYAEGSVQMCTLYVSTHGSKFENQKEKLRPCLDTPKNPKLYKILRHIEFYDTCIEY